MNTPPYTAQVEFRYKNSEGKEIIYICENNLETWRDLVREFEHFLIAQGYIFEKYTIFDRVEGEYEY